MCEEVEISLGLERVQCPEQSRDRLDVKKEETIDGCRLEFLLHAGCMIVVCAVKVV